MSNFYERVNIVCVALPPVLGLLLFGAARSNERAQHSNTDARVYKNRHTTVLYDIPRLHISSVSLVFGDSVGLSYYLAIHTTIIFAIRCDLQRCMEPRDPSLKQLPA